MVPAAPSHGLATLSRLAPFLTWAALLVGYHLAFSKYFPGPDGMIGHDYSGSLPGYFDGLLWFRSNGLLDVPWFTPSFCGGAPFFADPQSGYYSVPQALSWVMNPLAASYLTLLIFASIGFWGFYVLLRRFGQLSQASALLGGGLYMFDGFLSHRIITGENGFHPLPLLPWVLLALVDRQAWPCGPFRRGGNVLVAGLLVAYALQGGLTTLLVPFALSVIAVGLLLLRDVAALRVFLVRGIGTGAVAVAISASKLSASGALMSRFPRADYRLPGFDHLYDAALHAVWSLFGTSDDVYRSARLLLRNVQWKVMPHEWAYGFTPVAALFLTLGALVLLRDARRVAPPTASHLLRFSAVGVLFTLPIALLVYTPGWNTFLKGIPLVGQTSFPFRWILIYAPAVVCGAAWGAERALRGWGRSIAVGAALVAVVGYNAAEEDAYYLLQLAYPAAPVIDGDAALRAGTRAPAIHDMVVVSQLPEPLNKLAPNDPLVYGASSIECYNPVFGYRLEYFPRGPLRPGPALAEVDGVLNVKNPACYVFPEENGCAPGDHFRLDQRAEAEAFLAYHPFPFARSARQHVADATTMGALLAAGVLGAWSLVKKLSSPARTRHHPR